MKTFTKRVKKMGSSLGAIIPNHIVEEMNLKHNTKVKIIIKNLADSYLNYVCLDCNKKFRSNNDKPFCPRCLNENLKSEEELE